MAAAVQMDLDSADPEGVSDQIIDLIGCSMEDIIPASGKTGLGVDAILQAIVNRVPAPKGDPSAPLQAMVFDSVFNSFRGIIAYVRILNGTLKKGDAVRVMATGREYNADEIGILGLDLKPRTELSSGNVGYVISGIKNAREVKVGDTLTLKNNPCKEAVKGFEDVKPWCLPGFTPWTRRNTRNCAAPWRSCSSTMPPWCSSRNRLRHWDLASVAASSACCTWKSSRNGWSGNST